MVSSFSPAGRISISISVTKPNSYSLFAILSIISLSFPIVYLSILASYRFATCKIVDRELYGETFPAATSPGSIRVIECQTLAVEAAGVIELRAIEVEEAFHVDHDFNALVFEDLVAFFFSVVEVQLVFQTGAAPAFYAHAKEGSGCVMLVGHQF